MYPNELFVGCLCTQVYTEARPEGIMYALGLKGALADALNNKRLLKIVIALFSYFKP